MGDRAGRHTCQKGQYPSSVAGAKGAPERVMGGWARGLAPQEGHWHLDFILKETQTTHCVTVLFASHDTHKSCPASMSMR